jgi:hypothetical protein
MGWSGLRNGDLLGRAAEAGFEALLTGDQTLSYEQNLTGRRIAVVVLSTIDPRILAVNLSLIAAALDTAVPGSLQEIQCGTFSGKRPCD